MSKSHNDGLYLLILAIAVFLLLGVVLQHSPADAHEDFRAVVYGSRCLLHHCDPYSESQLYTYYQQEFPQPLADHLRAHTLTLYVNLPATLLLVAPFAMLPFALASVLWSITTAAVLILAALLVWKSASPCASTASGALIALSLISGAFVLGNGNPAGIVVGLAIIAVWCFLNDRFAVAGILALAVSLALKPHDAGLIWLYLVAAGGTLRKRALQTAAVTILISLIAVLWVSSLAPHWFPEFRSNLAVMSSPGGNNDPGPTGPTARDRAPEMIVSLQSVLSLLRNDPRFYNPLAWAICGALLVAILTLALRSRPRQQKTPPSPAHAFLALAAIAPITLLITYHRAYDARLLMLAIPACAMLAARPGREGKWAILLTALALTFTGELPYILLKTLTGTLPTASAASLNNLLAISLDHAGPVSLLLLAIFYTVACIRHSHVGLDSDPGYPISADAELPTQTTRA